MISQVAKIEYVIMDARNKGWTKKEVTIFRRNSLFSIGWIWIDNCDQETSIDAYASLDLNALIRYIVFEPCIKPFVKNKCCSAGNIK